MIIAVDFDGVLNATAYPNVGDAIPGAIEGMQKLHSLGHTLIIWTCRAGKELQDAIEWLLENEVPFVGVNCNTTERIKQYSNDSRKISADLYIDDCIIGGFPGWEIIMKHIVGSNQDLVHSSKLERIEKKLDLLLEKQSDREDYIHSSDILDVVDVASICKVAHRTIYNWVCSGKLSCFKANGRLLFKRTEVEDFISRRTKVQT